MMTTSRTAKLTEAAKAPMATPGDLAASPARSDDDQDIDNSQIDGGIDSTNGDNWVSCDMTCRVGQR